MNYSIRKESEVDELPSSRVLVGGPPAIGKPANRGLEYEPKIGNVNLGLAD